MGLRRPRFVEKTYETNCFSHSFNNNLMKRIYLPWTRICIWKKGWKWYALMHSAYNEMILKSIPKYISQYWVFVKNNRRFFKFPESSRVENLHISNFDFFFQVLEFLVHKVKRVGIPRVFPSFLNQNLNLYLQDLTLLQITIWEVICLSLKNFKLPSKQTIYFLSKLISHIWITYPL